MFNLNVKNTIENLLHPDEQVIKYETSANQVDRPVGSLLTPEVIASRKSTITSVEWTNIHNRFLTNFLNGVHGIPLNTLWAVTIDTGDPVFSTGLLNYVQTILKDNEQWSLNYDNMNQANFAVMDTYNGMLVAQGIKVVGDSVEIDRIGTKNTGYIQGLIGNGRTPFPTLDMEILENNTSFVDYVLRPWMVAISHKSLKDYNLKRDISVYILSRAGSLIPNIPRKIITYRNCCPIDIDTMEINYTADTAAKLRQVKFAFSHYEIGDMTPAFVSLIKEKLVKNIQEYPKSNNQSKLSQMVGGMVDKLTGKAIDLVEGTAQRIITNTVGTIEDKFTNIIIKGKQIIRSPVEKAIGDINDAVQKAVGKDYGDNSIKLNSYHEVTTNTDDILAKRSLSYIVRSNEGGSIDVNKKIAIEDVPDHKTIPSNIVNNLVDIPIQPVTISAKITNSDDTVLMTTPLKYKVVPNPPIDDARRGGIIVGGLNIEQNDHITDTLNSANILPNSPKTEVPSKTIKFIYKPTS